jgi:succinoglycan biosynthesis transport protein ExoP
MPYIGECKQVSPSSQAAVPAPVTSFPEVNYIGSAGIPPASAIPTLTGILWRGKLAIAIFAVCGLLAGAMVALLTKPIYRARTSLLLEGFNEAATRAVTAVSPLPASAVDYLQNEVKVVESDSLARRVAAQLGPMLDGIPGDPDTKPLTEEQRIRKIHSSLKVQTGMQSQVMELFFDAPDPVFAAKGVNTITNQLVAVNREARSQLVQDTTEWLNAQAAQLKAKLDDSNHKLQEYSARNGIVLTGNLGTPMDDRARQLEDQLTRAEADRANKQSRYEAATSAQGEIPSDMLDSGPMRQYQTDLQTMQRKLADFRTMYTPENNRITSLEAQVKETEAAIQRERAAVIARLRNDYLSAAALERMLSKSSAEQLGKVQQQTGKMLQYNALKNEVDTNQRLYDSVLERAKDAGAASSLRTTNIRVIDPGTPPTLPYVPNIPLNLALGLALGTLGGASFVLMRTRSSKIRQPGELTMLSVPELGAVPSASKELAIARPDSPAADENRKKFEASLLWESFRAVLTSILFRAETAPKPGISSGRVLVVTSLDMMEGKTTVVTNLGIASARHNHNVLLVDADLRRPRLHERFGLSNDTGLTDLLRNGDLLDSHYSSPEELMRATSLVHPTRIPHLWVLTSGPTDSDTTNLLYSANLSAMLQKLGDCFDLVFVDTPPMVMYPEARVLGRVSDGVVMVVRANTRSREELRSAYQKLIEDGSSVLGTILNDWKAGRDQTRSYSRYYRHYQRHGARS